MTLVPSPRALSIFTRAEVSELFKQAHRVLKTPGLTVLCAPQKKAYARLLVVTPALVGAAPKRNKIRRQLKALFYEQRWYTQGYDCVVLVRKAATTLTFTELHELMAKALANAQRMLARKPEATTASIAPSQDSKNSTCTQESNTDSMSAPLGKP